MSFRPLAADVSRGNQSVMFDSCVFHGQHDEGADDDRI